MQYLQEKNLCRSFFFIMSVHVDDTSVFCQLKDVTEIENVLNKEIANVYDWFVDNKLSFILVKMNQNTFFSVGIRTYLSLK